MAISARLDELKRKFDENPRRYFAPLANEYRKQGDTTQAIALCRTHLPNQPGHISGHIVLAQALYESRELAESRQIFEAALELDPENIIALRYLGDIAREQGSPSAAQAWYKRVLEFDPRNEEIAQLLADVRPEAEAELAEMAARPTPAVTEATTVEVDAAAPSDEALPSPALEAAPAEVEPEAAALEFDTIELEQPTAPSVSAGTGVEDQVRLAAPSEAFEMIDEPLDLYVDPTGDSWRESIAEEAGDAKASGQAAALTSDADLASANDAAPTVEASFDDWFAQPAAPEAAAAPSPEFEDFAPDLSAAAPASPEPASGPGAAADAIEEFSWSLTEAEEPKDQSANEAPAVVESSAAEPPPPVESSLAEPPEMEFTPWGAPETEPPPATNVARDESNGDEEAWLEPLPSRSEAEQEPTAQTPVPDESTADDWTEAAGVSSAHDADIDSAFEAEILAEEVVEDTGYAAEPSYEMDDTSDGAPEADDAIAAGMASSDPLIGRTPSFVPAVSEESSAAFVTETMAELYLQQGFVDEALSIYRQLLARAPGDPALAARVRSLEEGAGSAVFGEERATVHPRPDSESARAFFARFANRLPLSGGGEGNAPDRRGESAQATTVPLGGAAMPDEALTRPDDPTLTHIFSDRQVPPSDAEAARTLASAFGAAPDLPSASGGELSLQQLFRDVPARSSGAVTLGEQGTGASQGSAGSSGTSDPEVEAPADYEQFTAWLEGLKKK
jgi:tetratricopeptide (TPR) repeat protein